MSLEHTPEIGDAMHDSECCGHLPRRSFLLAAALTAGGVAALGSPAAAAQATSGGILPPLARAGRSVEWYELVPGFVAETTDAEGWPSATAFDNGNPWGMYTAYLMATNDIGQRTWRVEQYLPGQLLFGHQYAQGTTMYLLEGAERALLIDTGYADPAGYPAPERRVPGQDDLVTVVKHLLSHENDGSPRATAVDFVVANSHNHGDHTGKNAVMLERTIYYPALDWPASGAPANYVPIVEGGGPTPAGEAVGAIELGDRTIEAINVYGHTAGSMAYLDRENELIATGDALGSGFVYMQGGPLTRYQETLKHVLDVVRRYPHIAVLPAHVYQLRAFDRRLPPTNGRPSDREYISDQLDAVTGILTGSIVAEPFIAAGRTITWTRSNSAQICFRLDTMYPGGPFGGSYGPDILRVVRIPGEYKTTPWIDGGVPAVANIGTEFYLIRDNENTSMYLIKGSRRALLVGTGRGTKGTAALAEKIAGRLPLDVVVTSDDADQIGGVSQFRSQAIYAVDAAIIRADLGKRVQAVESGHVFDLGDDTRGRPARIEAIPLSGHSSAGLTLLSVSDRILLTGDALGEQFGGGGLLLHAAPTEFDTAFREWRSKTDGRYDSVYTSRNFTWFTSPIFVDRVQEALGKLLAGAPTVPSVRPAGYQMVQSSGPSDVIASIIPAGGA
jgi:glyoxylase-like metal-dependent hydrolase (beta-lactamase superfamily II)